MTEHYFSRREPREGTLVSLDRPEGYEPFLSNNAEELAALLVAVSMLRDVADLGGTFLSPQLLRSLESRLTEHVPTDVAAILDAELREIGSWLDERLPDEETNPDVSFIRSSGEQRWRAIVRYATEGGFDLRGEYYDAESETWPVVFGTPLFFDEDSVVLERVDGIFVTVLFRDTRWLMPVRQVRKPALADVLPFTGASEE